MHELEAQREAMVRTQIQARGVRDERVLAAMREVPRHRFVPEHLREFAYHDCALPIEAEQTISQPLIVAQMAEALEVGEDDRVLDVGTGSGYAAAVLSRMVGEVYTVERHAELLTTAAARFEELGYDNIHTLHSDGTLGWEAHAPYDGIAVAAAAPRVPRSLLRQLAIGGNLVIPVDRGSRVQELLRITRVGADDYREERLGAVQFVPLVGAEGWADPGGAGGLGGPGGTGAAGSKGHAGGNGRAADPADPGGAGGRSGTDRSGGSTERSDRAGRGGAPGDGGTARPQGAGRPAAMTARGGSGAAVAEPQDAAQARPPGGRGANTTGYAEHARGGGTRHARARTEGAVSYRAAPPLGQVIRWNAEPFEDLEREPLDALMGRIGDARLVLIGEASHGTSEFYRMRARITKELIQRKNFKFVAVEADWPDAARIDHYVRDLDRPAAEWEAFARFPRWMWRNEEVHAFVEWLRDYNTGIDDPELRVGFHGIDLYSLYGSIGAVLDYLDDVDPDAARIARHRYGCLTPWEGDPATYGAAAMSRSYQGCEEQVAAMLRDLLERRLEYLRRDGQRWFDAVQNARLVQNAEQYYRVMYHGSVASWNLRDQHMFDTLKALMDHWGEGARGVVWAHNSHLGNAAFTEMGARGEHNVGQLARQVYGQDAYLIGFGTHTGTVAAAHDWDGDMEVMRVRPSHEDSYERASHEAELPRFLLPLRPSGAREALMKPRLERAIGVIYRPTTELMSHYFQAVLPRQFDEWIWFDETRAVTPLSTEELEGVPETYPFGV